MTRRRPSAALVVAVAALLVAVKGRTHEGVAERPAGAALYPN